MFNRKDEHRTPACHSEAQAGRSNAQLDKGEQPFVRLRRIERRMEKDEGKREHLTVKDKRCLE